jgi:hypothetical protein
MFGNFITLRNGVSHMVYAGPIYMTQPSNGVKKFVATLNVTSGIGKLLENI